MTIIRSRHICCVFESLGTLLDYDHLMITGGTKDLQTENKNKHMKNLCSTACLWSILFCKGIEIFKSTSRITGVRGDWRILKYTREIFKRAWSLDLRKPELLVSHERGRSFGHNNLRRMDFPSLQRRDFHCNLPWFNVPPIKGGKVYFWVSNLVKEHQLRFPQAHSVQIWLRMCTWKLSCDL